MQTAITFGAEVVGCFVPQGAMGSDAVVFAPPPAGFSAGIRHRFEFLAIQKFVAQSAVEGLDEAILPGTRPRHRDRIRSGLRKPGRQNRADELRAVVAADPGRASAAAHYSRQHASHLGAGHRNVRVQRQALPSIFVHQRQPLERTSVRRAIVDEVVRPHVVFEARRLVDATVGARARHGGFPEFLAARRSSHPQSLRWPPHPFAVDAPTLLFQTRPNALVAIARMTPGEAPDRLDQRVLAGALPAAVPDRRTCSSQEPAGPPLGDAMRLAKVVGGRALLGGGHHFFFATSWSICLSSISSATRRLSRSISPSSSRTCRASSVWGERRCARQRNRVTLLIPSFRLTSANVSPLARSRSASWRRR